MTARARGLVAATGLALALGGVPVIITVVAGGPPTSPPSWSQVVRGLDRPISDHAVLGAVAVLAWVLWLLFCAAVVLEAVAVARRRPGPSTTGRGLRVPGLQGVAGSLVLATVLALSSRPVPMVMGMASTPSAPPVASATLKLPVANLDSAAVTTPNLGVSKAVSALSATPPALPYTVVRYDSPWEIAERHLGNGLRWREIRDDAGASLAVESTSPDDSDDAGPGTTARVIYPGQVLLLPPDARGVPGATPAPSPVAEHAPHPVVPPVPVTPPADAPTVPTQPPDTGHAPDAAPPLTTVWTGSVTAFATQEPTAPAPAPAPMTLSSGADAGKLQTAGLTTTQASRAPVIPLTELLLGAGFLASAALNVITARRVRQGRRSGDNERVPLPDLGLRRTELALRRATSDDLVAAAHRAVAALASDLERVGQPTPLVDGVLVGDDSIDMLLAQPMTPPPPWKSVADGRRWRMAITDIPAGADLGRLELFPGLVPIGQETTSGSDVLLNLEASAVTGVSGAPETAAGLIHGAAMALSGLPWARGADVILVGFGHLLATSQAHMRVASSVAAIGDELRSLAATSASRLRATGGDHVAAGRLRAGSDGLAPTIIVAPDPLSADEVTLLAEVCRHDTAITALVAGDIAAPRMLRTETNPFYVPDLRITVSISVLPGPELTAINQILSVALSASGVGPDAEPYRDLLSGSRRAQAGVNVAGNSALADPDVVIQVLGSIEVDGAGEFRRPHAKELAVYLAMHPRGVAEHQLDEALWPERHLVKATTRDPVVSSARTALGGHERMPYAHGQGPDKRYRITDQVGSDWSRFCERHAHGRRTRTLGPLSEALALVQGRPFADVVAGPGYGWLHLEGHLHHMEAEVVDAADLAGQLFMERGDPVAARWAANQGLLAGPYAERLWVRLMAVADALGEAQEVERILVEMDRRLGLDGDYAQLHPDTIDAYRRYSRRNDRRRAG
ncbi:MAG: hypothetical protein M3137_18245 [Actinomycetota bacterium]|nr:hypothetical protein [Actinomycetota bacterium]